MSKSFIQECQEIANTLNDQKNQTYVEDWHKKYNTKMFELTDKYHKKLLKIYVMLELLRFMMLAVPLEIDIEDKMKLALHLVLLLIMIV